MPSEPEARRPWAEAWRSVGVGEGASAPASAADPVEYLRRFSALPGVAKYKSCSIDSMQLQAGMRVLDVGCGLGGDLLSMASRVVGSSSSSSSEAEGQVVGIDSSAELIKLAQQQHEEAEDGHAPAHGSVSLQVADAYRLPFADASFDAVREDRVLQHLTDPAAVIREMLRVLCPGGRLVVGGPDWRTLQCDVLSDSLVTGESSPPPALPAELDFDLAERTTRLMVGAVAVCTAHPFIGTHFPRLLRSCGLEGVSAEAVALTMEGREAAETVWALGHVADIAVQAGAVSEAEAKGWLQRLAEEGDESFFGVLTLFVCSGTKPSAGSGGSRL